MERLYSSNVSQKSVAFYMFNLCMLLAEDLYLLELFSGESVLTSTFSFPSQLMPARQLTHLLHLNRSSHNFNMPYKPNTIAFSTQRSNKYCVAISWHIPRGCELPCVQGQDTSQRNDWNNSVKAWSCHRQRPGNGSTLLAEGRTTTSWVAGDFFLP